MLRADWKNLIKLEKKEKMTSTQLKMKEKLERVQLADEIAAWEMYRYFEAHPEWLNRPDGLRVYHTVKNLVVLYNQKLTGDSYESTEEMISFAAKLLDEEKAIPEPSQKTWEHFLHYREFENKLLAYALIADGVIEP